MPADESMKNVATTGGAKVSGQFLVSQVLVSVDGKPHCNCTAMHQEGTRVYSVGMYEQALLLVVVGCIMASADGMTCPKVDYLVKSHLLWPINCGGALGGVDCDMC